MNILYVIVLVVGIAGLHFLFGLSLEMSIIITLLAIIVGLLLGRE